MIGEKESLTVNEAKEFFFDFLGNIFYMNRENPEKYKLYQKSKFSKELEEEWRYQILESLSNKIMIDSLKEDHWIYIGNYIEVYSSINNKIDEYTNMLFELLNYTINNLDVKQRILIIEHMVGRSKNMTDGGIYLVCRKSKLKQKLKSIITELVKVEIDIDSDVILCDNLKERYYIAIKKINKILK